MKRVVVGSLGIGLLVVFLNGLRAAGSQAAQKAPGSTPNLDAAAGQERGREPGSDGAARPEGERKRDVPVASSTVDADIAEFLRLLAKLRENDESVVPEMRALAERLCTVDDRCDGKDILAFYAAMSPDARTRGLEEEAKFDEIYLRLRQQWNAGLLAPEWETVRDLALAELRAIADESAAGSDLFPVALAQSHCARIEADRLVSDYKMEAEERDDLIARAKDDAVASLANLDKCGMLAPRLEPLWVLGHLQIVSGSGAEARGTFEKCLALADRLRRPEWQERAFGGLIALAKEAGDVTEIAQLLNELASFRTPDESWFLVREQATLFLQQDLGKSAGEFLLAHRPSDPAALREWHILLGSSYFRQNDLNSAREEYAAAHPLPFSRDVSLGMASVDLRGGNAQRVLEQLSKPEFLSGIYPFEETLALQFCGEAALRLDRPVDAIAYLEHALRIGGDIQSQLSVQRDLLGSATSVVGERVGLHALALLAEACSRIGDGLEAARAIESWQARTLRGATGGGVEISEEDLLSWARSTDLGLVTWVVGADSTVVAHVAPDGSAESVTIRRGLRAIEAAVRRLNEALRGNDTLLAERLSAQVKAELIPQSISSRIASLGIPDRRRLLVLVHGPLERLPVEFLWRDDQVVPLILPGLPNREPGTPLAASDLENWSLMGSPVDSEGRAQLPGAREEIAAIAGLHQRSSTRSPADGETVQAREASAPGATVTVGTLFDRHALANALRGRWPVHIATHLKHGCGRAEGRLADVGLELSGTDVFCAREIAAVKPRLPLAVLAACETAEGRFVDAEGLQGIARTFLESGTRNLLVTLWPVEDQAARRFAQEFHRALLAGAPPSEAAARARAVIRAAGTPAVDWAAFRLIGRD